MIEEGKFKYLDEGKGEVILLLHGLFGALSNFQELINHFKTKYRVVIPILPIYELPLKEVSLEGLVAHVSDFVDHMRFDRVTVLGNSLGGHIALLYALASPERIRSAILTGSSGLFENAMGSTYPAKGNYEFVKNKTESTFYDPKIATKELIDEVFETVNDREKTLRILYTAKSAIRHNLGDKLGALKQPTLLIWGKQDIITPPLVGERFHELIENSELHLIDKCGHAPMMERPDIFNEKMEQFLDKHI